MTLSVIPKIIIHESFSSARPEQSDVSITGKTSREVETPYWSRTEQTTSFTFTSEELMVKVSVPNIETL